jgi:hypothetical protein
MVLQQAVGLLAVMVDIIYKISESASRSRRLLDPLDSGDPKEAKEANDLWQWTKANIHLPGR